MYGKVLLGLALVAFVSVQLADSLKCYECKDIVSCQKPTTVQCDQAKANATRDALANVYQQVNIYNSTDFACFVSAYKANNTIISDIRGCIMKDTVTCSTPLKNTTWVKETCTSCTSDLCNTRNSVGTYSFSIVTMISLLVLSKIFAL